MILAVSCCLFVCFRDVLSHYFITVFVELKKDEDENYSASCDISSVVSCSKLLTSEYSRLMVLWGLAEKGSMLDVPNTVLGMSLIFVMC